MYNHTYTCTGCNSTPCICCDEWLSQQDIEELQTFSQSLIVDGIAKQVDEGKMPLLTSEQAHQNMINALTKEKTSKMPALKLIRINVADAVFRTIIRVLDALKDFSFKMWAACVRDRFDEPGRPKAKRQ